MNKYELVVIVDANIPQEEKESVLKEAIDIVNKSEGKVINSQVWQERQRMAFRIQKKAEGTYYLINYEAPSAANLKIRQALRLNERVLRNLIVCAE